MVQVVRGQLVDRELAAQAAAQIQHDLSHDALIDAALGGLGLLYVPFTVLPEAGEVFEVQWLDSPITTYGRSAPVYNVRALTGHHHAEVARVTHDRRVLAERLLSCTQLAVLKLEALQGRAHRRGLLLG